MRDLELFLNRLYDRFARTDRQRAARVLLACMAGYLVLVAGKYMLVEGPFYRDLADRQQLATVPTPVNRGAVVTDNVPAGILATSAELADIAVDPGADGDRDAAAALLTDIVREQLCGAGKDCSDNLANFLRVHELPESFDGTPEAVRASVSAEIRRRLNKKWASGVFLKAGLSAGEKERVAALPQSGLYLVADNLYADPEFVADPARLAAALAQPLSMPEERLAALLSKRASRYEKVVSRLDARLKEKLDARLADEREAVRGKLLDPSAAAYPFVIEDYRSTRFYPDRELAAQVVGFVDHEGVGRYGLEGYFDNELAGRAGFDVVRTDIRGRPIRDFEEEDSSRVAGVSLKLTLDRSVQKEVERVLENAVKEYRANRASAVVMDPKTGAVVAMANWPSFDPNEFGDVYQLERFFPERSEDALTDTAGIPVFVEDPAEGKEYSYRGKKLPLRQATPEEIVAPGIAKYRYRNGAGPAAYANYSIGSLYEPGSVFKAFTMAAGIDAGEIRPEDRYEDKNFVQIDRFKINNLSKEHCGGYQTFLNALNWSCNVGMIEIVKRVGPAAYWRYLRDFGFGERTGITLDGEVGGKLEPWQKWSRTQLFTTSFGQGVTATVLQMAAAYSAIANGGTYMRPYIVREKALPSGQVIKYAPKAVRRVIKESTAKTVAAMLTRGVEAGFAHMGAVPGYDVAGKTGTSQIASRGGYEKGGRGHTITSFGGFAPSSNPKFVLVVQIERPRSSEYSEATSSAMFATIAKYLLSYYGIPRARDAAAVIGSGAAGR